MSLSADLLLRAYGAGIFPMAESAEDREVFWVDPDWRGILPLDCFHLPRRLRRTLRQEVFDIRCDTAFASVIRACAAVTVDRPSTWINDDIERVYAELFAQGHAHSVEAWYEGHLVGGLYGVSLGGAFFGESMFSRMTDASKIALAHLVARLRLGGYSLLDTQFVTDHLTQFGAVEIPRTEYRARLARAVLEQAYFPVALDIGGATGGAGALAALQSSTQTS